MANSQNLPKGDDILGMSEEKKNLDSESVQKETFQETQKEATKCCGLGKHSSGKIVLIILFVIIFFGIIAAIVGKVVLRNQNNSNFGMMRGREVTIRRPMSSRFGQKMRGGRIAGKISAINSNNITISYNNQDLVIVIADNTAIYKSNNIISKDNLKVGDEISVEGAPNSNGQVNASAIIDQS
jgi:hypothetical protein